MAKDTITLALNGDITLDDFSVAIREFLNLVNGLRVDVAANKQIEWLIIELDAGSALTTVKGVVENADDLPEVEKVADAYLDIGYAIRDRKPINYSHPTQKAAHNLMALVNGRIRSLRFETPERDVEIFKPPELEKELERVGTLEQSYGAVRGRVESMTRHNHLRFTLYDLVDDRAISCYLSAGSEEVMRDAWGKIAMVEGIVHRDPETGHATTVRSVTDVRVIQEGKPGDWRKAIGVACGFLGNDLPEDVIRRARDE
jgi:hypothetical protein